MVKGVGNGLGVVDTRAVGMVGVGRWVEGWVVVFGVYRLLLGLRCFLVREGGAAEGTLSDSVFFAFSMNLGGGL